MPSSEELAATISEKYFDLDLPPEEEIEGFSCPHHGCDGMTFDSTESAKKHDDDWHQEPYQCGECGTKFAARPALRRHIRASGHDPNLVYTEKEVIQVEARRITQQLFVVIPSRSMQTPEAPKDTIVVEDQPEELPEDFKCTEECCPRFGTDFVCISEYRRHALTEMHRLAASVREKLKQLDLSPRIFEAESEALRAMKCNAVMCNEYEKTFNSFRSCVQHLSTTAHRDGYGIDLGDLSDILYRPDDIEYTQDLKCTQEGCPLQGRTFSSKKVLKQHTYTTAHLRATMGTPGTGLTPLTPLSTTDLSTLRMPPSPISPLARRGSRTPRKLTSNGGYRRKQEPPSPSVEARIAVLENENKELRQELQGLKDMVKGLSTALEER